MQHQKNLAEMAGVGFYGRIVQDPTSPTGYSYRNDAPASGNLLVGGLQPRADAWRKFKDAEGAVLATDAAAEQQASMERLAAIRAWADTAKPTVSPVGAGGAIVRDAAGNVQFVPPGGETAEESYQDDAELQGWRGQAAALQSKVDGGRATAADGAKLGALQSQIAKREQARGQLDRSIEGFVQTYGRPPTPDELARMYISYGLAPPA
jgi:hypothetical protein